MRIAALPLVVEDGNVEGNLAALPENLDLLAPSPDVVVLPELWTSGFLRESWPETAQRTNETVQHVSTLARKRACTVAGSIVARDVESGSLRNRMFFIERGGAAPKYYDKAHLFRPFLEDDGLAPGNSLTLVQHGGFTFGLAICYDLRFPEMFRNMAIGGADVFLVSAEWPAARADTLELLARARAVESFCYLVLSNRSGTASDGTEFGGEAIIFGPDGRIVDRNAAGKPWALGEISREELDRSRSFLNALGERSPGTDVIPFCPPPTNLSDIT